MLDLQAIWSVGTDAKSIVCSQDALIGTADSISSAVGAPTCDIKGMLSYKNGREQSGSEQDRTSR